jgi:hypothetical protein
MVIYNYLYLSNFILSFLKLMTIFYDKIILYVTIMPSAPEHYEIM